MPGPDSAFLRILSVAVLCLVAMRPDAASAQTVAMGDSFTNGGNVNPPGVETILSTKGANFGGVITSATFGWSASPCPAAAKIKVFRPSGSPPRWPRSAGGPPPFTFVAERGPFDVTTPLMTGYWPDTLFAAQTVTLTPPIAVMAGDLIAITNVTTCGGQVYTSWPLLSPSPLGFALTVPGDVSSTVTATTLGQPIFLFATGSSPELGLLSSRFSVSLVAMDPRTGTTAVGVPNLLGSDGRAGYFSLPEFTGDPTFPEVTVKMVDATGAPALGGGFWFFHAPLTDVSYTLTVRDLYTGDLKTYSSGSASPGQLCGGVDTSAFPGRDQ